MKAIVSYSSRLLVGLLLWACDRSTTLVYDQVPGRVVSIAYLKSLCDGPQYVVTEQIAVCGRVTGNNRYGEFPYEIVIQDTSGGICIAADYPALQNSYPLGCELIVYCNGLTLYDYGGKIEIGKPNDAAGYWESGPDRRISEAELVRYLRITAADVWRPEARPIAPEALDPARVDMYVRVDGVRLAGRGTWCDRDPQTGRSVTTEHRLTDVAGNPLPLALRTSGSAVYADEPLPEGCGSLCGILDYFGGAYTLRITALETAFVEVSGGRSILRTGDCGLDGQRVGLRGAKASPRQSEE